MRWAALLVFLGPALTFGQAMPSLSGISPDILVISKTTEVTLSGDHISDATKVLVLGDEGVTAVLAAPSTRPSTRPVDPKVLHLKLAVSPNAPRGQRQIRLITPLGLTGAVSFTVEDYAPIAKTGKPNSIQSAQAVSLPAVLTGAIHNAGEADFFKFHARKGQRMIFEVMASRIGSAMDSSLYLYDPAGKEAAHDEDSNGLDSLIDYTVPVEGWYTLRIQDLEYRGGGNYFYRIRAGEIPYVAALFPLGGQRGQQVSIELTGANLASSKMKMTLDPSMPMGRRDITAPSPHGLSNARSFEVSDLPEQIEAEPNDSPSAANPTTQPVVINGRIGHSGDMDCFALKVAKPTSNVVAEIFAQRYGSSLDALLTLMDEKGNVLQRADDISLPPPADGRPQVMSSDARLEFRPEANKTYVLAVTDLLGRGGANFPYRLQIAPPPKQEPDFEIVFQPEAPRVARSSHTRLWCQAVRKAGYDGDIVVALLDAPAGVTCEPLILSNKHPSSGLMLVSASADAPLGTTPLTLIATGHSKGKTITHFLEPRGLSKEAPEVYLTVLDKPPFRVKHVGDTSLGEPAQVAAEISSIQKKLSTQTPELDAQQAKWEAQTIAKNAWHPLEFTTLLARYGSKLVQQPDGTLLSTAGLPSGEVYNLVAHTKLKGITAIKLEAIADDNLGPGRNPDGNFVLSTFEVFAAPTSHEAERTRVDLERPTADFTQAGFNPGQTLNTREPEHQGGWAVFPQVAQSHWAVWYAHTPVTHEGGTTLSITIDQHYRAGRYILRKFRLLVSNSKDPKGDFSLPTPVLTILEIPAERRTEAQKKELSAYYRTIAPSLQPDRDRLAHLKAASSPFPPVVVGNGQTSLFVQVERNGFEGEIALSAEGFTTGVEPRTQDAPPIKNALDIAPVKLKGHQTEAVLTLKTSGKTEHATRMLVIRADATVNGQPYTQYSELFPLTVKDAPAPPKPPAAKAR